MLNPNTDEAVREFLAWWLMTFGHRSVSINEALNDRWYTHKTLLYCSHRALIGCIQEDMYDNWRITETGINFLGADDGNK